MHVWGCIQGSKYTVCTWSCEYAPKQACKEELPLALVWLCLLDGK